MNATKEVKRFSEVDWYGYCGCLRFEDASEPFILHTELIDSVSGGKYDAEIVGDSQAIGVHAIRADDELICYILDHHGKWNSATVETFLRGLATYDCLYTYQLKKMGFEED